MLAGTILRFGVISIYCVLCISDEVGAVSGVSKIEGLRAARWAMKVCGFERKLMRSGANRFSTVAAAVQKDGYRIWTLPVGSLNSSDWSLNPRPLGPKPQQCGVFGQLMRAVACVRTSGCPPSEGGSKQQKRP